MGEAVSRHTSLEPPRPLPAPCHQMPWSQGKLGQEKRPCCPEKVTGECSEERIILTLIKANTYCMRTCLLI